MHSGIAFEDRAPSIRTRLYGPRRSGILTDHLRLEHAISHDALGPTSPTGSVMDAHDPETARWISTRIRLIAGLYVVASVLGFVAGAIELAQAISAGGFLLNVPIGIGISGGAISRGLVRRSRRAWKWARRISIVAVVGTTITSALILAFTEQAEFTVFGIAREVRPWDPVVLTWLVVTVLVFGWQYRVLSRPEVREQFT